MASYKVILRENRQNAHGEHPLYLRITHNRKKRYKKLEISLSKKFWNPEKQKVRKSHPQSKKHNIYLDRVIGKVKLAATELKIVTAENIKNYIEGVNTDSFIEYAERLKESYSYNSRDNLEVMLRVLKKYRSDVRFSDITISFLRKWEAWMLKSRSQNTASEYMKRMQTVLNRAMEDGLISVDENVFITKNFTFRWEDTSPTPLTPEEFKKLRDADLPEDLELYRDMFLFSVYMDGMRFTDVLTFENDWISDGRALYRMSKTNKRKEIQLVPAAMDLVKKYENESKYAFPVLNERWKGDKKKDHIGKLSTRIWQRLQDIAALVGLDKLHFHMARSTSGFLALQNGWSLVEIQEMLGHAKVNETRRYLGKMNPDLLTDKRNELFSD